MDSSGSGLEQVAGSSEHGYGTSRSIKFWEVLLGRSLEVISFSRRTLLHGVKPPSNESNIYCTV